VAGCPTCLQPAGVTRWTSSFLQFLRLPNREGASFPLRRLSDASTLLFTVHTHRQNAGRTSQTPLLSISTAANDLLQCRFKNAINNSA